MYLHPGQIRDLSGHVQPLQIDELPVHQGVEIIDVASGELQLCQRAVFSGEQREFLHEFIIGKVRVFH